MEATHAELPHAFGPPSCQGRIRVSPDDFVVDEILGFEPSGAGEHFFLRIEKRGENTDYVARQLAHFAGVPSRDVSYAGLKDRHARTLQWFCVRIPGKVEPDWHQLDCDSVRIVEIQRNARKLKPGAASGNRFELTIRDVDGDRADLESRLQTLAREGVPNYFGEQRFGREGQNVARAREFFAGTGRRPDAHQRGLYLSAARSEIFNRVLARRVELGSWNRAMPGDVFMFPDSHSFFRAEPGDPSTVERLVSGAIHPSGPLWGRGPTPAEGQALKIEQEAISGLEDLCEGLERAGLEMARRPLRLCPEDLRWEWPGPQDLRLSFQLPAGAYATTVLREIIDTRESAPERRST